MTSVPAAGLVRVDQVASTQDEVHRLAGQGAPHATAVLAARQLRGRGSRGRSWDSPAGGLWLSVLWRPAGDAALAATGVPLLGIRAGLAAAAVVETACPGLVVHLKWPNDIVVNDRKVGGILCEAKWQGDVAWVAVGIGLNVHNPLPDDARFPAGRLGDVAPSIDVDALAASLAGAVAAIPGASHLDDSERAAWRERDWLWGRAVREPMAGVAAGITSSGHLLVTPLSGGPAHEVVAGDGFAL